MKILFQKAGRLIATVLAVMLVLSTVSVGFTAFAEGAVYTVEQSSPAVPMSVGTVVAMKNLEFETATGDVIKGETATITLADGENDGVVIDGDSIYAKKKGTYCAYVTNGTDTVTVFIVVKDKQEKVWTLYSADFTGDEWNTAEEKALPSDWVYQIGGTNIGLNNVIEQKYAVPYDAVEGIPSSTKGILITGQTSAVTAAGKTATNATSAFFTLNDPVVKAFKDYTVRANMLVQTDTVATTLTGRDASAAVGFFVHADGADENGKFSVGNTSAFNAQAFTVNVHNDANFGGYVGYSLFSKFIRATENKKYIYNWSNIDRSNATSGQESPASIDLSLRVDGTTATLSEAAGDKTVFEEVTVTDRTGNVGVYVGYADGTYAVVEDFYVYLNNDVKDCPIYSGRYEVDLDTAPAIPMNRNTYVYLRHIGFKLGGTLYAGSDVTVTENAEGIDIINGAVYAYETGVYPVTVNIDGADYTAFVAVKDFDDSEWRLADENYSELYQLRTTGEENPHPDNWVVNYAVPSAAASGWQEIKFSQSLQTLGNSEISGWKPFMDPYRAGYPTTSTYSVHASRGYATYTNGVVEHFSDYTIYYTGEAYNHWADNAASGTGLFGRAAVDTNGMLDRVANSKSGSKLLAFSTNNENSVMSVVTQTLTSENIGWQISSPLTSDEGNTWANWPTTSNVSGQGQNQGTHIEYALKYSGNTATFWNPADTGKGVYTATVPANKGAVGVFGAYFGATGYTEGAQWPSTWCTVDTFKVVLNNASDELPYAQKINVLEPLGATIRPETANYTAGIRFGARAYSLHLSDNAVLSDDTVTVDGFEYPIVHYGTIMLPKVLLGGNDLVHGIDLDVVDTVAGEYSVATENYADFTMTLTGIPEKYKTLDISCRPYVAYKAGNEIRYVYGDAIVRNYYGVQKEISGIYPLDVLNPDFDAEDFSTFDITYDSMDNQGVWDTPDSLFDEEAEALREEVYNYSVSMGTSSRIYYVDPTAATNGSGTQSSPFNNLDSAISKANSYYWSYPQILIKRGTVVRGNFTLPKYVSLGAYGDTSLPKPVIMGSDQNYADLAWSETETENVYSVPCTLTKIGNVVFNYGQAIGRDRTSVAALKNNFDYYSDGTNLYVYCNVGNPGDICQSIEIGYKDARAVLLLNNSCTVQNIQIMFGGAHGIQANGSSNVKIRGTVIGFIGGAESNPGVKYGNGIEFWNDTSGAVVDSCYVFQCYDTGVTHQFTDQTGDTSAQFKNITYKNNLIEYNYLGFEYFNTTSSSSDTMTNITFTDNIIRFTGYGFGEYTRPDHTAGNAIRGIGKTDNSASSFKITNNIIDFAKDHTIYYGASDLSYLPTFSGNTYGIRPGCGFWRLQNLDSVLGRQLIYRSDWGYYDEGSYQLDDLFAYMGDTTANPVYYGATEQNRALTGNAFVFNERFLNNTAYRATNDKELNVVYLGGSVTHGNGASNTSFATGTSWAAKVHQYLVAKYPDAAVKGYNAAIGGTGSYFGLHRLERDVYSHNPDLLFVEFAVNDLYQNYTEEQSTVFMESLIRDVQNKYPNTDIVMVLVTNSSYCGADYTNLLAHEKVANHYGIPVINVGKAIETEISSGAVWSDFSGDQVHPNDAGHQIYADAIIAEIGKLLPDVPAKLSAHKLPEQYITNLLETPKMITADQIGAQTGWTLESTTSDTVTNSLRGYGKFSKALVPSGSGATLTYEFTGSAFGMVVEPGSSQNVTVTVDGAVSSKMVENSGEEKIVKVIFDNLVDGKHTVEITYGGSGEFAIGAFLIG